VLIIFYPSENLELLTVDRSIVINII